MSEHRRRARRSQLPNWENETNPSSAPAPERPASPAAKKDKAPDPNDYFDATPSYGDDDIDWGTDPAVKSPASAAPAPKKRISAENLFVTCVLIGSLLLAIAFCVLIYFTTQSAQQAENAEPTAVPYDITQPFLPSDITDEQMTRIEENGGSFALMDYETGPHGIKIGHSLDTLLSRFPLTYTQSASDDYAWDEDAQNMSGLTYNYLETDYQVIYAARVFYLRGEMIVLPPSATMTIHSDQILVTLTAPLTPYPEGTAENYLAYPHVYCRLTINPETSKITRIVLGKSE